MNEFIEMIKNRRTIRKYKSLQISNDELNAILDAGLHAPNAGGRQSAIIVVIQNEKLIEELGIINRNTFKITSNITVSNEQPSIIDDPNIKNAFYEAPVVLVFFALKNNYNLTGDCFIAAENIIFAAHSLGIGSCMIARAAETFETDRGKEIQKEWGLSNEYEARVFVTLGYIEGKLPLYKPRKENRIIFIK